MLTLLAYVSFLRRTEDWMPDSASHRWSYYAARMRSAIALSNRTGPAQEFSGYIVVGSSGAQNGGLLQRPLTLVGSGAKVCFLALSLFPLPPYRRLLPFSL